MGSNQFGLSMARPRYIVDTLTNKWRRRLLKRVSKKGWRGVLPMNISWTD